MLALLVALALPANVVTTPPVSLSAPDGRRLDVTVYDADVLFLPPLAFTELRVVFHNAGDAIADARLEVTIPDGAAVSRFAMNIVDGQRAAAVLEEAELVAALPSSSGSPSGSLVPVPVAVMTQTGPNVLSAQVATVPARATTSFLFAWSEELTHIPWRLRVLGLQDVGQFTARARYYGVTGAGGTLVDEAQQHFTPTRDLRGPQLSTSGFIAGKLFVGLVNTSGAPRAPMPHTETLLLVERTARRAGDEARDRILVRDFSDRIFDQGIPGETPVVVAFNERSVPLANPRSAWPLIDIAPPAGACDLGQALDAVALLVEKQRIRRVVLFSDGVVTAGVRGEALLDKLRALRRLGVLRLDAVTLGPQRDIAQLRRLTLGVLPEDGIVIEGMGDGHEAVMRATWQLEVPTSSDVAVQFNNASAVWPTRFAGLHGGQHVTIYAELTPETANHDLRFRACRRQERISSGCIISGEKDRLATFQACRAAEHTRPRSISTAERSESIDHPSAWREPERFKSSREARCRADVVDDYNKFPNVSIGSSGVPELLVRRSFAASVMAAHLDERDRSSSKETRAALEQQIVARSLKDRVLSPFTSFVVLASPSSWREFGIERRATTDVLTIQQRLMNAPLDAAVVASVSVAQSSNTR